MQRVEQRVRSVELSQCQGLPGARHRHIIEPAWRILILVAPGPVPTAVQHCDMVEFQPLGAVAGQQQKPLLAPADVPAPFRQPFDEMADRRLRAAGFQGVLPYGLP